MAEDLEKSTFRVHLRRHIMYWKYAKLLNNLGNALEALIGPIEAPEAVRVYERAVEEGAAVLSAARITWATREEQAEALSEHAGLLRPGSEQRRGGSSWQSLARGAGSIEADYLNGEIVLLGREFGVPTPVNTFLQRAANRHARMGKAPGTVTVQEVLKGIARSAESCQVQ
jgi:2-dehydropantoate 2-reductase